MKHEECENYKQGSLLLDLLSENGYHSKDKVQSWKKRVFIENKE